MSGARRLTPVEETYSPNLRGDEEPCPVCGRVGWLDLIGPKTGWEPADYPNIVACVDCGYADLEERWPRSKGRQSAIS